MMWREEHCIEYIFPVYFVSWKLVEFYLDYVFNVSGSLNKNSEINDSGIIKMTIKKNG
jgi:hypothetical protein